jgi:hypothetical protein
VPSDINSAVHAPEWKDVLVSFDSFARGTLIARLTIADVVSLCTVFLPLQYALDKLVGEGGRGTEGECTTFAAVDF